MARQKRSQQEVERARLDILWAAAEVFGRRGVTATRMQEIAQEAGCATSTVYAYFSGKSEMLEAVIRAFTEELLGAFDLRLPRGATLEQSVELLVDRLLTVCERRRGAMFVLLGRTVDGGGRSGGGGREPGGGAMGRGGMLEVAARLERWFAEKIDPRELGRYGPEVASQLLLALLHSVFFRWAHQAGEERLTDQVGLVVDLFLHGIGGGAVE